MSEACFATLRYRPASFDTLIAFREVFIYDGVVVVSPIVRMALANSPAHEFLKQIYREDKSRIGMVI